MVDLGSPPNHQLMLEHGAPLHLFACDLIQQDLSCHGPQHLQGWATVVRAV